MRTAKKMNKEIRIVDEKLGTVQVTTLDERWYGRQVNDPVTKLPVIEWRPSVTWIASFYPKGIAYMQWLAKHGWDEAEALKVDAGDRGTIVHHACEKLINEGVLFMDDVVADREGNERQMTPDEYYCVITFGQWYEQAGRPKVLAVEQTVAGEDYDGTLDYLFEYADGSVELLDLKTSKYVFPGHRLQVSALARAAVRDGLVKKIDRLAILQVGYTANKTQHFKHTVVEDVYPMFRSVREIWAYETAGEKPLQRDYPAKIVLGGVKSVLPSVKGAEKVSTAVSGAKAPQKAK
jgi:hypothetical protein